jgi:hypothetical protein
MIDKNGEPVREFYRKQGAKAENKRIVEMLEAKSQCSVDRGHDYNGDCYCEIVMRIIGIDNEWESNGNV